MEGRFENKQLLRPVESLFFSISECLVVASPIFEIKTF